MSTSPSRKNNFKERFPKYIGDDFTYYLLQRDRGVAGIGYTHLSNGHEVNETKPVDVRSEVMINPDLLTHEDKLAANCIRDSLSTLAAITRSKDVNLWAIGQMDYLNFCLTSDRWKEFRRDILVEIFEIENYLARGGVATEDRFDV